MDAHAVLVVVVDVVINFGADVLVAVTAFAVVDDRERFIEERRRDCRNIGRMGCMVRWRLSLWQKTASWAREEGRGGDLLLLRLVVEMINGWLVGSLGALVGEHREIGHFVLLFSLWDHYSTQIRSHWQE